jgi:precorrin-6A/cobalt-precorrin-6A reductase
LTTDGLRTEVLKLGEPNPKSSDIENLPDRSSSAAQRILILGGTREGTELATRLAARKDLASIYSFAGRVSRLRYPEGSTRVGGFGGIDGLISYLLTENITAVVDATHPFSVTISRNIEIACARLELPLIAFTRPEWLRRNGDLWHEMATFEDAANAVDTMNGRVFLSIGRQEVGCFAVCNDVWFLIRAIEEPTGKLPRHHQMLLQRGPFDLKEELQLLRDYSIDYIVSKNSGGSGTYTKIEAARLLGIPVVMVKRPVKHTIPVAETVDDVVLKLAELSQSRTV